MTTIMAKKEKKTPQSERDLKSFLLTRFDDQEKREEKEIEALLNQFRHLSQGKGLVMDNSKSD